MSGSEMIANILLTFMPAGLQVTFAFLKVGERAAADFNVVIIVGSWRGGWEIFKKKIQAWFIPATEHDLVDEVIPNKNKARIHST